MSRENPEAIQDKSGEIGLSIPLNPPYALPYSPLFFIGLHIACTIFSLVCARPDFFKIPPCKYLPLVIMQHYKLNE
jgi:hypothetical protein